MNIPKTSPCLLHWVIFPYSAQHVVLPKIKYLMKEMEHKDGKPVECVQVTVCSRNAGHWTPCWIPWDCMHVDHMALVIQAKLVEIALGTQMPRINGTDKFECPYVYPSNQKRITCD